VPCIIEKARVQYPICMALSFTHTDSTVSIGDTIRVHQEISEGDKSRVQIFEGLVIAIKNSGSGKSFTVRRMGANGVGVERIYPLQMPGLKNIQVKTRGEVKRSKLYYLRDRVGKAAIRIKEKKNNTPRPV
jgi:large subunit ribosomal protein L19